jgi:taspase (threonine aspartase 1)
MMGCGVWAQDNIAVTTTGIGEYLIKTIFAKECAQHLLNSSDGNNVNALNLAFNKSFFGMYSKNLSNICEYNIKIKRLDSPLLKNVSVDDRLAGVLALVYDKELLHTELLWGHSTASMCIGFMSSSHKTAKALVSQMPHKSKPGHSFIIEAKSFNH